MLRKLEISRDHCCGQEEIWWRFKRPLIEVKQYGELGAQGWPLLFPKLSSSKFPSNHHCKITIIKHQVILKCTFYAYCLLVTTYILLRNKKVYVWWKDSSKCFNNYFLFIVNKNSKLLFPFFFVLFYCSTRHLWPGESPPRIEVL